MGERQLQHWVPQHHMRLFAGNPRRIGLVTRAAGIVVSCASIRHQCARHMFYGDKAVEAALGRLETRHAGAYRAAVRLAWDSGSSLSAMQLYLLREALILQRGRTPGHAAMTASTIDQAQLHVYAEHLRASRRTKKARQLLLAIKEGRVRLRRSRAFALQVALAAVQEMAPLSQDLMLRIIRNRTDVPFLLGDAPSIFTNDYQREVTFHGVLGITTQGLMIAMPLDSRTYLLAHDPAKYRFFQSGRLVELENPDDVVRLNRLQALASEECLYFADLEDAFHAQETLSACPYSAGDGRGGFQLLEQVDAGAAASSVTRFRPVRDGDASARGDVLMMFERQLPETLRLSVFETVVFEGVSAAYGPRSPALVDRFDTTDRTDYDRPLGIDELVRDVEEQLEVW